MRSGFPGEGVSEVVRVGDDDFLATPLQEVEGGLYLRAHAASGKVTLLEILCGFLRCQVVNRSLIWLAEVEVHLLRILL